MQAEIKTLEHIFQSELTCDFLIAHERLINAHFSVCIFQVNQQLYGQACYWWPQGLRASAAVKFHLVELYIDVPLSVTINSEVKNCSVEKLILTIKGGFCCKSVLPCYGTVLECLTALIF